MKPTILALLLLPACAPINGTYHYSPGNTAFLVRGPPPRSSAMDERNKLLAEYRRKAENKRTADGWQAAEDNHICNSYNPTGCLSPEQEQAMATNAVEDAERERILSGFGLGSMYRQCEIEQREPFGRSGYYGSASPSACHIWKQQYFR